MAIGCTLLDCLSASTPARLLRTAIVLQQRRVAGEPKLALMPAGVAKNPTMLKQMLKQMLKHMP